MALRCSDFDFHLPPERIAQTAVRRGASRLLVLPRRQGPPVHSHFRDIADFLRPNDCLVVNNTRVIPARLWARKTDTQARIEILLHRELEPGDWEALARPCKRLKPGTQLRISGNLLTVVTILNQGRVRIRFSDPEAGWRVIREHGTTPLPPYIARDPEENRAEDQRRYQTIFARADGSVAAPTAGLHFSDSVMRRLRVKGVRLAEVTLHVGWGTFSPLPEDADLEGQRLHPERFSIPAPAAEAVEACRKAGGRVIACGTTAARALESAATAARRVRPGDNETDLFIQPGYAWKAVDGLVTNFHLPRSSLLILVCSLAGKERVLAAYQEAVDAGYRFYSYGDAMLIL